jgi:hypothetical protein
MHGVSKRTGKITRVVGDNRKENVPRLSISGNKRGGRYTGVDDDDDLYVRSEKFGMREV